jgi:hypothetical protein
MNYHIVETGKISSQSYTVTPKKFGAPPRTPAEARESYV